MANPISRTAYYTLTVRANDAASAKPIGRDTLAQTFMNDDARRVWQEFQSFKAANASNASRHVMIDDHLQAALNQDPQVPVIIIGAGFDTRAFRLKGGNWFEFDEPEILNYKESRLPAAGAPNPLRRISVEFGSGELPDKLAAVPPSPQVHVIVEGVFMYLTIPQRRELLTLLGNRFPHHTLYCDLMRKRFLEKYSADLYKKILGMGTSFQDMVDDPEQAFLTAGYRTRSLESVTLYSAEHGDPGFPAFMVRYFMRTLRDGYVVGVFDR